MKRFFLSLYLVLGLVGCTSYPAQAGSVYFGVSDGYDDRPPPVFVERRPVIMQSPPVVVERYPVYTRSFPHQRYYESHHRWNHGRHGGWHKRHHKHWDDD
jgi:hypothetical protein